MIIYRPSSLLPITSMQQPLEYNLDSLTDFNQALVYGFEPEIPVGLSNHEHIQLSCNQHIDTLAAYQQLAQEFILPVIKMRGLKQITPNDWIKFIKGIHQNIGFHLLKYHGIQSGNYARNIVLFRWHPGCTLVDELYKFLSKDMFSTEELQQFCLFLENKYHYPHNDFQNFIRIVVKISADSTVKLDDYMIPREESLKKGKISLNKLHVAYYNGKFTEDEKEIINKIVKLPIPFQEIPAAMNTLASKLVSDLQSLDFSSIDNVSQFLADLFYDLTSLHPFPNANGRTATCLVNILLRAMDYPSILLRLPNENEDPNSLYSRAIADIDNNRDLLLQLIKKRIVDAQQQPFSDLVLKEIIQYRVTIGNEYARLSAEFPTFDIDSHWDFVLKNSPDDDPVVIMPYVIDKIKQQRVALTTAKQSKLQSQTTQSFHGLNLSKEQQLAVLAKLKIISGIDIGWKAYKSGSIILLEHPSKEITIEIAKRLNNTNTCKALATARKDGSSFVVKVTSIDLNKLLEQPEAKLTSKEDISPTI